MNTSELIEWGGIILILLLIFAETGLLLGLIIPGGETLVFTSGLLASTGVLNINIYVLLILMIVAGLAGDTSGYLIGRRYGRKLYDRPDKWYFKKKYLHTVENFFRKYKRRTIILGKFLPVVRPFTPITAGIARLKNGVFLIMSFAAQVLYMGAFVLAGYFLGSRFPELKNYLHWILPATVIILVVPVIWTIRKEANKNDRA